jgi:N-acetylglucosaminyl-diphospho-decaprenol L-rhamnosyltransferase
MVLSVIIVSYNVKHFLEQCLCSVQRAAGYDVEVIVVDNNSSDGSVDYLRNKYPFAHFIVNKENTGFARANNQALAIARGKYVLFLNPDTIIPEDLFTKMVSFMEAHTDAGALGVRMIDGGGKFLKESKRGFPSPAVAFCKMSGLTTLFPSSKLFAKYYLGHLPEKEMHAVDALAGACMLVRKEVLDKTGGFDEQFFMYAEDIDLSYRIQQAGYKNYYFPGSTIIHFKGESTRKDRKYVRLFYKAMIQFVRKHFGKNILLEMAINMRAAITPAGGGNENETSFNYQFSCTGNEQSCNELPNITGNTSSKKAIILCEGPSFSFKKIIEQLQDMPAVNSIFIHGKGTCSAVGSTDKNGRGEIYAW